MPAHFGPKSFSETELLGQGRKVRDLLIGLHSGPMNHQPGLTSSSSPLFDQIGQAIQTSGPFPATHFPPGSFFAKIENLDPPVVRDERFSGFRSQ